ncbi:uncharacterized protein VK521_008236 [Ammospiza maritima maritima]
MCMHCRFMAGICCCTRSRTAPCGDCLTVVSEREPGRSLKSFLGCLRTGTVPAQSHMSPAQFGTGASHTCHAQKFYTVEEHPQESCDLDAPHSLLLQQLPALEFHCIYF